jgi:type II secretory pathway pseudopilin PulG
MVGKPESQHRIAGVTLIEAMILVVVLGAVALGTGSALQNLTRQPKNMNLLLATSSALVDKMEYLRSLSFTALTVGTTFSDTVAIEGTSYTRSVTVALADADGNGAADSDFKSITVTVNGQSLVCYVTAPT